ncbi:Uncharacterised protein [Vibrio cholerae]|uniref:Uncharacterized protein n=1 Tax=Vibrio cholerae TaxID=666 RepID=A0A655YJM5_VIBCL|nr:Uncharacterised protein [Vibrio cholerae]
MMWSLSAIRFLKPMHYSVWITAPFLSSGSQ